MATLANGISTSVQNVGNPSRDKKIEVHWYTFLSLLVSMGSYVSDVGLDIRVAYEHYRNGHIWFFSLTTSFIIGSMLIMTVFSLRWYVKDYKKPDAPKPSSLAWAVRIVMLLLQLGPLLRTIDTFIYGVKVKLEKDEKKKRKYYDCMTYEDADAGYLRLFEAFIEAAPQTILQIYILALPGSEKNSNTVLLQKVSCCTSLISISWTLASQQRSMRISQKEATNPSWPATIVQGSWYLFVTSSRILALGLFASVFPPYLGVLCGIHWILMTGWLFKMKTAFCESEYEEYLYRCAVGVILIFAYYNQVQGSTRKYYITYYLLMFLENTVIVIVWYCLADPTLWYRLPCILYVFLAFFVGIGFMVVYYILLHPSIGTLNSKTSVDNESVDHEVPDESDNTVSEHIPLQTEQLENTANGEVVHLLDLPGSDHGARNQSTV